MVSLASRTGGRRLEGERRPVTRRSGVAARIRRAFFISPQDDDAALRALHCDEPFCAAAGAFYLSAYRVLAGDTHRARQWLAEAARAASATMVEGALATVLLRKL